MLYKNNGSFWGVLLFMLISCSAANAQAKKQLTPDDYGKWQSLTNSWLSDNGKWVAWHVNIQKDNDTLFIQNIAGDKKHTVAFGNNPIFSKDDKWVAYKIGVPFKERERLEKEKKPSEPKVGFMNLESGYTYTYKNASDISFSNDGKFLIVTLASGPAGPPSPNNPGEKGRTLLLRNIQDSSTRTIANVASFAFNKKGDYLAYIIDGAHQAANSVELVNLKTQTLKVIASDTCRFSQLSWQREGEGFSFLKTQKSPDFKEEFGVIYTYTGLYKTPILKTVNQFDINSFPKNMRIVPDASVSMSEDMSTVFFGINDFTAIPKKDTAKNKPLVKDSTTAGKDSTKVDSSAIAKKTVSAKDSTLKNPPGLDIWHWKDKEIQPRQKLTYDADLKSTYLSAYNFDKQNFIQIADSTAPRASIGGKQKFALTIDDDKYKPAFKEDFADIYITDIKSGNKKMLASEKLLSSGASPSSSPDGHYLTYFKDKNWWIYNIKEDKHLNLTKDINTTFENIRNDHPATKPPFGAAGWTKNDKEFLVYDEYNIYALQADGKKTRKLTNGEKDEIVFRIVRTDSENRYFDESAPIYLSAFGDKTKKSGYYQLFKNVVTPLIFDDRSISRLSKAKDANTFTYVSQRFSESPSLVVAGESLKNTNTVPTTNPQQKDYFWGKSELVNFQNKKGQKLQGSLFYPANYEPGKKYPMVVYIYELLSDGLHSYVTPTEQHPYNTTNFTANGYFVFQPDIVYDINDAGMSAVNCVVPAVEEVLKTGMIDKEKVGLMGHSWGAYQTCFIITQTDLFKAAVAGAPLTNLISMSLSIYWNSGIPDQKIFETTQGRFDGPWYERKEEHIRNSPIFEAKNINTPLMVAFGDKDGAVDWHQGIEMYGTMRRMQKDHLMLVYANENHSLRDKENQIDYQKRIFEYFAHYLLGNPAPKWIAEGVKFTEKMKK